MTMAEDIKSKSKSTFADDKWTVREGRVVPEPSTIAQRNDAVHFEQATFLYADLDASTSLVDQQSWTFSAEVYKAFLYAAARLIRDAGGTITSYDGDRVMGVFIGDPQTTPAVKCALKINYAVKSLIQPELNAFYDTNFKIRHVVGIDTGEVRAANAGTRGDADLTWIGRPANYAAKLTAMSADYSTWITAAAFNRLSEDAKFGGNPKRSMWEKRLWTAMDNAEIYRSNWWWSV
jgi:class 3 adenylate cyclase